MYRNLDRTPSAIFADESNPLVDAHAYHANRYAAGIEYMTLGELADRGGRITRLRILSEKYAGVRMCDISYVHGVLPDGTSVSLHATWPMGFNYRELTKHLIEWAREEGVYAKRVHLLDPVVRSIMF